MGIGLVLILAESYGWGLDICKLLPYRQEFVSSSVCPTCTYCLLTVASLVDDSTGYLYTRWGFNFIKARTRPWLTSGSKQCMAQVHTWDLVCPLPSYTVDVTNPWHWVCNITSLSLYTSNDVLTL
jgi:hypothetical protein